MQDSQIEISTRRNHDVTGVLLAGGKNRRMGQDKACLEVSAKRLFDRALEILQGNFRSLLIAGDRPDLAQSGIPTLSAIYPGSALGYLYTRFKAAITNWIFVTSCDMPHPNQQILDRLLSKWNGFDADLILTTEDVSVGEKDLVQ